MIDKKQQEKILSPEFLEEIKKVREERGISTAEVAEKTNIKESYIVAIETGDLSSLPGGVYNKAYIRSISEFLDISTKPFERIVSTDKAIDSEKIKVELGTKAVGDLSPSKSTIIISLAFLVLLGVAFNSIIENNRDSIFNSNESKNQESSKPGQNKSTQTQKELTPREREQKLIKEVADIVPENINIALFAKENQMVKIVALNNFDEVIEESRKETFLKKSQIHLFDLDNPHLVEIENKDSLQLFINGVEFKNIDELLNEDKNLNLRVSTLYSSQIKERQAKNKSEQIIEEPRLGSTEKSDQTNENTK